MINLLEYKKYVDIEVFIEEAIFKYVTEYNYPEFKDTLVYKTFDSLEFLNGDVLDLEKIKDYDTNIYDLILSNLFKCLIWKTFSESNTENELTEEELINMSQEEYDERANNKDDETESDAYKKSVYFKTLKASKILKGRNNKIDVSSLESEVVLSTFIKEGVDMLNSYGYEYNPSVVVALKELDIIN